MKLKTYLSGAAVVALILAGICLLMLIAELLNPTAI